MFLIPPFPPFQSKRNKGLFWKFVEFRSFSQKEIWLEYFSYRDPFACVVFGLVPFHERNLIWKYFSFGLVPFYESVNCWESFIRLRFFSWRIICWKCFYPHFTKVNLLSVDFRLFSRKEVVFYTGPCPMCYFGLGPFHERNFMEKYVSVGKFVGSTSFGLVPFHESKFVET